MRHGGKIKLCSHDGCTKYAKKGGVCIRHGAQVKLCERKVCSQEGCSKSRKEECVEVMERTR